MKNRTPQHPTRNAYGALVQTVFAPDLAPKVLDELTSHGLPTAVLPPAAAIQVVDRFVQCRHSQGTSR
jgi:hypothetical protein